MRFFCTPHRLAGILLSSVFVSYFCFPKVDAAPLSSGNGVSYDADINLTWTQDANLFKTQTDTSDDVSALVATIINYSGGRIYDSQNIFDTPPYSGYYSLGARDFNTTTGQMSWWGAQAWINYLNRTAYAGHSDWRLPKVTPVDGEKFNYNVTFDGTSDMGWNTATVNSSASELAHIFYYELGNKAFYDTSGIGNQAGWGLTNSTPFDNLQSAAYWAGTEHFLFNDPGTAWYFDVGDGTQGDEYKYVQYFAWAVRTGHASEAPVPSAIWLFGSAVAYLAWFGQARKIRLSKFC